MVLPLVAVLLTWGLAKDTWAFGIKELQETSDKKELKVMTWNVGIQGIFTKDIDFYNNAIHDSIISTIQSESPDILCLQEFVARENESDTSIYQIRAIADKIGLPYYFYSYNPKFDIRRHSHYGKVIFSKYPIVHQQMVNFDSLKYNNSFEYVDIQVENKAIRVATFHLQSLMLRGKAREITTKPDAIENRDTLIAYTKDIYDNILGSYEKRVKQSQAVEELISSTTLPLIVCGDMNDVPSSYAYTLFTEKLEDAFLCSGRGLGKTYDSWIPNLRIDYIFYNSKFMKCREAKVIKVPYSDHFPLVTFLSF